jgi:hypothetical protein
MTWVRSCGTATWHHGYEPTEYSDVFFTYDRGEGSDAPSAALSCRPAIPDSIWSLLDAELKKRGVEQALVWVSNLT